MTQTVQRPSQQAIESIRGQFVRSGGGRDLNTDGARVAYQQALPTLFEEILWLRAQYATAHAALAQGVPVESDDQEDLARLSLAVVALWRLQEQGLYAKPALAKLKEKNEDLTAQLANLGQQCRNLQERQAHLEQTLEKAYQDQREMALAHQVDLAERDARAKQRAQKIAALLVEAHGIVVEDAG